MVVLTIRERSRQRAKAATRKPLVAEEFCSMLARDGIEPDLAAFLWDGFEPYYFAPLTPYPTDRIYGDMRIDPDDISDIALRFEKRFEVWLGEVPIACPDDPTIAELAAALQDLRN